ncbi:MAG: hypothetical protein Q8907_10600 [Bacteroidota bacterium]|nr:hypothetical protein [Bacteroidota bacterium]MDP4224971.1 hypothetical protein [Bacteroidota bacterium]MDP4274717.1 hypothetical protein [Bacteroidota bacterium]
MKKTCLLILMTLMVTLGMAQNKSPFPTRKQISVLLKSKTYVVLDNPTSGFSVALKKAVQEDWKLTPYEFISDQDFQKLRYDSNSSFLVFTKTKFEKDEEGVYYNFINLLLGDTTKDITLMPEFASVPVSYVFTSDGDYLYKFPVIIRFIQDHVKLIDLSPNNSRMKFLRYYNKNIKQIKSKTLLLTQGDIAKGIDPASIATLYKHPVKIVSHKEIEQAINQKSPDMLFLHKVGPSDEDVKTGRSYVLIFGTDDSKLYYFNYHDISAKEPDGFTKDDFERIR